MLTLGSEWGLHALVLEYCTSHRFTFSMILSLSSNCRSGFGPLSDPAGASGVVAPQKGPVLLD